MATTMKSKTKKYFIYTIYYTKKVPPWYAGQREAWWTLTLQRYELYLNIPNFFERKCTFLPNTAIRGLEFECHGTEEDIGNW